MYYNQYADEGPWDCICVEGVGNGRVVRPVNGLRASQGIRTG